MPNDKSDEAIDAGVRRVTKVVLGRNKKVQSSRQHISEKDILESHRGTLEIKNEESKGNESKSETKEFKKKPLPLPIDVETYNKLAGRKSLIKQTELSNEKSSQKTL